MVRPENKARAEVDRQLLLACWGVQDRDSVDLGAGLENLEAALSKFRKVAPELAKLRADDG